MTATVPILDGHNDTLTKIFAEGGCGMEGFLRGCEEADIDLPRARAGGLAAGFFAIYIRSTDPKPEEEPARDAQGGWTFTPPAIDPAWARAETSRLLDCFDALLAAAPDDIACCRTVEDVRSVIDGTRLGIILHLEGCEMISPDLRELDALYARGVRSLGPVWSRPNCFGHGIRFGWPSSNDIGPGLTAAGKALVRACNDRGILIDLSHLNFKGFMDVADISDAPLVATHCGCHALAESARNLTDEQLGVIAASGGLVGCNFFTGDLRGDGRFESDMPLTRMAEHIEHLVEVMGEQHVALGSDFDGADMCDEMQDVSRLPAITALLRGRGWSTEALTRLCHGNWLRVLDATWPDASQSMSPA
ncbi:MAG: dipeptidase [Phycisphaerales bacterium]|jgi:membrane dipeptidase|nr:dipeptidase [Phycisphaerales bacterium]